MLGSFQMQRQCKLKPIIETRCTRRKRKRQDNTKKEEKIDFERFKILQLEDIELTS